MVLQDYFHVPTARKNPWALKHKLKHSKTAGGIVLGSVAVSAVSAVPAVSAVSADVLLYISVAIKASFLKLGMCNICKNNIAKMFLDFF